MQAIRHVQFKAPKQAKAAGHTRVHRRRLVTLLLALLVICGVGGYQLFSTHQAIATRSVAVSRAKRDLARVKSQKKALNVQIDQLKNADYLEKLVRQKYAMSKKGETIFTLPGE
ncbi:FtsB family cell division protein [Lacticaseibacillus parakribbianus]|uniref:FtsB family cell division protein n=1 Tax=Lacticaseibacillus parakribbianus TaxID=2970927 RepID=UPI0021CB432C|nr:septum formation initiator family protein [Lacticaseibacillus parakribbianus]